jgi:AP-3 complex subunit beta
VIECVIALRRLLFSDVENRVGIVKELAFILDRVEVPSARAGIISLINVCYDSLESIVPDMLRKLAQSFIKEQRMVKLAILHMTASLLHKSSCETSLHLSSYILGLARCDDDIDIRDYARLLNNSANIKDVCGDRPVKKLFSLCSMASTATSCLYGTDSSHLPWTLSSFLSDTFCNYDELSQFPSEKPDGAVRDIDSSLSSWVPPAMTNLYSAVSRPYSNIAVSSKAAVVIEDLDTFLRGSDVDDDSGSEYTYVTDSERESSSPE